ncbi:MAG TPA: hypothetical protein VG326_11750 [Tepidisphaeraceae bacterium]|jgi:hypothetical protein|nr:hypothetical protein [Tepidisphaeraceae bacterium]
MTRPWIATDLIRNDPEKIPKLTRSGFPQSNTPLTPQRILRMTWSFAIPLTHEAAVKHRVSDRSMNAKCSMKSPTTRGASV